MQYGVEGLVLKELGDSSILYFIAGDDIGPTGRLRSTVFVKMLWYKDISCTDDTRTQVLGYFLSR